MKIKNIIRLVIVTVGLSITISSCSDWLGVDMEDAIMEDKLYETNEGFLSSLNGIYTSMNETYASTLGMGVVDVMAQYYNVSQNSSHNFYVYANYEFGEKVFESMSGGVWTNLYSLIANLNSLLEHCDKAGSALHPTYYPIVKGEALALRAMLHFDLLRLYGPIYTSATESNSTIPYQETTSKEIQPLLPAKEVLEKVIRDLTVASDLLKEDPIRTEGVMDSDSENPNEDSKLRYRQYRLNYYAVQALLARAYQWKGAREEAYKIASDLIKENKEKEVFPWTPKANAQASSNPDRLFSTEVMFGLYNISRVNLYDRHFKESASISNSLTFVGDDFIDDYGKFPYFYTDDNDVRRGTNMWSVEELEETDQYGNTTTQKAICLKKYAAIASTKPFRYMIPLIRMSEIYMIAAECSNNLTEAIGYINELRKNRNCMDLELKDSDTEEEVQEYITAEFAREVIGEGQLYFYYKRHAMTEVMSGTSFYSWSTTASMDLGYYVWPLPKAETDKRITSN